MTLPGIWNVGADPGCNLQFETRDRQGNLLRYNADDDDQTLGELVRQERFGAGAADQKNLDAEMAGAIARDAKYEVSVWIHISCECLEENKRFDADEVGRMILITWMTTPRSWRGGN